MRSTLRLITLIAWRKVGHPSDAMALKYRYITAIKTRLALWMS